jgi:hypothetical protein
MRGTLFLISISVAFAMVVGSACAGEVPAPKPTEEQRSTAESSSDLNNGLQILGCGVVHPDPSACSPDDRKCEVASKLHGCVNDRLQRPRIAPPRF